ncbi:MerR family transcriptional regulator [Paenibacillus sp. MY03]|uniref:MerR family DNA-binding transcriptional regulator n=1 Tax=Paenibacillus agaridevorans TaxID=171404 RepID=A0A2R5EWI0_9BACL|nr:MULTISPECIES: MerR family transcriptional regulator [Paenibacillus]OUS69457.1 MerR family transcriptional regulator [Paenibacillus sp. MY03]GBG11056.1 MerR family DNA-binding transcriptional regulator [Paenibacillus agaridevorans]
MSKKVIGIGMVRELTGLTERQIRYYEDRQLIFPERTPGGARKFSFEDVEQLKEIDRKLRDGFHTFELRKTFLSGAPRSLET